MENIKRVSFEIYNGNIWTQVTLICIALEYGRHAARLTSP